MLTEAEPEWLTEEVKTGVSPPSSSSRLRLICCAVLHFRHTLSCLWLQTTILAIEFDGGVVLGSDSRVSAG